MRACKWFSQGITKNVIVQAILELNRLIDLPPFSLVWLLSHGVSDLQMFVILRGFVLSVHINRGLVLSNFETVTVIKDLKEKLITNTQKLFTLR